MDKDDPKLIDLPPHEWKSETVQPREPFFGAGWPKAIAFLIHLAILTVIVHWWRGY